MKQSGHIVQQGQLSADPASPASGYSILYPRTDDDWYIKSPGGTVKKLMANPMTTANDLILGGASGSPSRLAVGAEGTFLKVVSGNVAWAASEGLPAGGTAGQILGKVTNTDYDVAWIPYPTLSIEPGYGILISSENEISVDPSVVSGANSYFVDSSGLSTGSGSTEATAITMGRLVTLSASFVGGERIFFKAGGRYNGRIVLKSGSFVGRYGTGADPIVSGAVPTNLYTWSQAGAVWSTTIPSRVGRILLNGVAQRTAQSAYYPVSSRPASNQITSSSLVGLSNVTQMEVITKEYEFRFSHNSITAHNSGTGTITIDTNNGIVATYGFKLFNHESLIAADGDWAWRSNVLYWRTPGNVNPNTLTADIAIYDEGLVFEEGGTGFTVDGVEFYGQAKDGIYGKNVNNVKVVNSNFHDQLNHGIALVGSNDGVILQMNRFDDIAFGGIGTYTIKNFNISGNRLQNIGTQADPPFTRDRTSRYDNIYSVNAAILVGTYSGYGYVTGNYMENLAYIGIRVDGNDIVTDRNTVYDYSLRQNDGAGIYTNGNNGDGSSIAYDIDITNNIVGRGVGFNEGGPVGQNLTSSVYLDNYTTLTKVTGNTCFDNGGFGVFVGGTTKDIDVRGNIMHNNARAALAILNWPNFDAFAYQTTNIKVEHNTMVALSSSQRAFFLYDFISTAFNPADAGGYLRDNSIVSPYSNNILLRTVNGSTQTDMTLATAVSTYAGEPFGQKDDFSASFESEAAAKLAVPLKINLSEGATTIIVPENHRNPINKYFDPVVPGLSSTVFVNTPFAGGGGGGGSLQAVTDIGNTTDNSIVLLGGDPSRGFEMKNADLVNNLAFFQIRPSGGTNVGMYGLFIPKGTGFNADNQTGFDFYNTDYIADPSNYEVFSIAAKGSKMVIGSSAAGTGVARPIHIQTGGTNRIIFHADGAIQLPGFTGGGLQVDGTGYLSVGGGGGGSSQWTDITPTGLSGINLGGSRFASINTTAPFPGIDPAVAETGFDVNGGVLMIGSNDNTDNLRTNGQGKAARILIPHYSSSEEAFSALIAVSNSTDNALYFGGVSGAANSATSISFYTGASNTTLSGTERMAILSTGAVKINSMAGFGAGLVAVGNDGTLSWTSAAGGGGGGTLQSVTDAGNSTDNPIVFEGSDPSRNFAITNANLVNNYAFAQMAPSGGTNVGMSFLMIPKGTGFNADVKTGIDLYNTDYLADGANYEAFSIYAAGSKITLNSSKAGTGTVRPIHIQTAGANRMIFNASGGIQFPGFVSGVLEVDASGNLSVGAGGGGGSSNWTVSGSEIYRNSGVGIGAAPSSGVDLHINKSTDAVAWLTCGTGNGNYGQILIGEGSPASGGYATIERFSNATTGLTGEMIISNIAKGITMSTFYNSGYRKDLGINASGIVRFNDAYSFPNTIGSPGQVLTVPGSGTGLTWSTVSGGGGMTNPMTNVGDLIVGTTAGAPARLGIGTNGYYLKSNGTTSLWASLATDVTTIVNNLFPETVKFFGETTNLDEINLTGTMLMPVGESGYLDVNCVANTSDNSGQWMRRYIIPYRVTSTSNLNFGTHTNLFGPFTSGTTSMTGTDAGIASNGSGGLRIPVVSGVNTGVAWEVVVIKYKAVWAS